MKSLWWWRKTYETWVRCTVTYCYKSKMTPPPPYGIALLLASHLQTPKHLQYGKKTSTPGSVRWSSIWYAAKTDSLRHKWQRWRSVLSALSLTYAKTCGCSVVPDLPHPSPGRSTAKHRPYHARCPLWPPRQKARTMYRRDGYLPMGWGQNITIVIHHQTCSFPGWLDKKKAQ